MVSGFATLAMFYDMQEFKVMKENDFGIDFGKYNKLVYGVLFPLFIILMCALAEWMEQ